MSQSDAVRIVKSDAWDILHKLLGNHVDPNQSGLSSLVGKRLDDEEQVICQAVSAHLQVLRSNRCGDKALVSLVAKFPDLLQFLRNHCHQDNAKALGTFGAVVPFGSYPYLQQAAWIARDTATSVQIPEQTPVSAGEGRVPYWIAGVKSHEIQSFTILENFIKTAVPREKKPLSIAATMAMARSFPELLERPLYVADGNYIIHSTIDRLQIAKVHPQFRIPAPSVMLTFEARFPESPMVS